MPTRSSQPDPHVVEDGVVLVSEAAGLGDRLDRRTRYWRSLENSQRRMVLGIDKTILGLDGDGRSGIRGAISW